MIANKVLDILDKNGFDWWGKGLWENPSIGIAEKIMFLSEEGTETRMSKAELATNKSALEAVKKYNRALDFHTDINKLQLALINDLTEKKGNFWNIWAKFMGIEGEE